MVRVSKNSNEKLARVNSGLDGNATHFSMDSENNIEDSIRREQMSKLEQDSADFAQKFDEYAKNLEETAGDLSKRPNLQIAALYDNLLVDPFKTNPFQKIQKTASGIIYDMGGDIPTIHKSDMTGEFEEEEQYIFQGTVQSAGPDCKYIKEGDIVMWTKGCQVPVPFFKLGFMKVNERNVICVVNDDLQERFAKLSK